jgi:hypothetical protein
MLCALIYIKVKIDIKIDVCLFYFLAPEFYILFK